jgi:hypothetical protein
MKTTIIILTALIIFIIGVLNGLILLQKRDSDKIQELQIRCHFLEGYKDAYMNHVDKCDTLHSKCFKIGE